MSIRLKVECIAINYGCPLLNSFPLKKFLLRVRQVIILSVKKQSITMIRYSLDTTETVGTAASNRSFVRGLIRKTK